MDRFGQFTQGAVIGDEELDIPEAPEILPGQKMKLPDPKNIFNFNKEKDDWRKR